MGVVGPAWASWSGGSAGVAAGEACPVEYKLGRAKEEAYLSDAVQLAAQALCLRESRGIKARGDSFTTTKATPAGKWFSPQSSFAPWRRL